jgi:serine/threonine protein kinase
MADRVGQQLGNYRLIRLLGRGGFAEVYLGEHIRLKTQSAIKVLRTQLSDNDVEGFLNEAQTIAHLEHPHIVRVFDFDVIEGVPFLFMSYAPNGTLRQRHPKGTRLPPETIVEIATQQVLTPPPPLREKLPGTSPAIEQVVMRALAKDPRQRFASVQEFATQFEQACHPSFSMNRTPPASQNPTFLSDPGLKLNQFSLQSSSTSPLSQPPSSHSPSIQSGIAPQPFSTGCPPAGPQGQKRRVSRRVVLAGLTGIIVVGAIFWLFTSIHFLIPGGSSNGPTNLTVQGTVVSVNVANHTVSS